MLHVEKRRRRNLDKVDLFRSGQLFKRMRTMKEQVNRLTAKTLIKLVEMTAAQRQLVGKDVGQGHDLRGGAVGERRGHGSAAVAAAQQAQPYRQS